MSIVFCEFILFVNIKYLHNIRDNKLNQEILMYFFYMHGKQSYENFSQFSTKFKQKLMDWSLVYDQPFHKLSWILVQYLLRYLGDRQTNKQRWKHNLLAEVIK